MRSWLLAIMALMAAAASAAPPQSLVCYNDLYEPFFMRAQQGFRGLNADLVIEAGRRAGVQITLKEMPWRRIERQLLRGVESEVQCAFAFSKTAEREGAMVFGRYVLQRTRYVLLVRAGQPARQLAQLHGGVIGVRRAFRLPDVIRAGARAGDFRLEEVGDDSRNLQKLVLGRVDAIVINQDVARYLIRRQGLLNLIMLQPALGDLENHMVVARGIGYEPLLQKLDDALRSMHADGTEARIRQHYFGGEGAASTLMLTGPTH